MKDAPFSEFAAIVNPELADGEARPRGSDALWSELTQSSGWFDPGASKGTGKQPDPFIAPSGAA